MKTLKFKTMRGFVRAQDRHPFTFGYNKGKNMYLVVFEGRKEAMHYMKMNCAEFFEEINAPKNFKLA